MQKVNFSRFLAEVNLCSDETEVISITQIIHAYCIALSKRITNHDFVAPAGEYCLKSQLELFFFKFKKMSKEAAYVRTKLIKLRIFFLLRKFSHLNFRILKKVFSKTSK